MIRTLAAALLMLLGMAASTAASTEEWSLVAINDGWAEAVETFPEPAQPVWAWSAECAPVRLKPGERPQCGETVERTVQVTVPVRQQAAGIELRWGTEKMLREIPDALLPMAPVGEQGTAKLRVPKGQRVFVRAAGPKLATGWTLAGEKTRLAAVAAMPVAIAAGDGEKSWIDIRPTDVRQPQDLGFRGAGRGRVTIPPIPAESYVHVIAWSETRAPSVSSARANALPQSISLPPGQELKGVIADDEGNALPGTLVAGLFAVPREGMTIAKRTRSAADGSFHLRGLPAGEIELTIEKSPFATRKEILSVAEDTDLGQLLLDRTRALAFLVLDPGRAPIPDATVQSPSTNGTTNAKGTVTLQGVPASSFDVQVSARGFLPRTISIDAGARQPVAVHLERAAQVRARLIDKVTGLPVQGGTVEIDLDRRTRVEPFEGDGIELDDLTGGTLALEIRANGLSPFRLPERKIAPGETVDLGTIPIEPGIAFTGRTLDASSRAALAGVSVRVLRPSAFGALLSFFRRDYVSAQSGADGSFRVAGLAPGTYALWTAAPGRAPLIRTGLVVSDEVPGAEIDLGELLIEEGRRAVITCTPAARCGSEAVITLPDAEWFEITGPLVDGAGEISPVPSGPASLRLAHQGGVIHQREITIGKDPATDVRIRLEGASIVGRVLRAGRPAGGGTVMFTPPGAGSRFIHVAQRMPAGVISNEIVGNVPRRLTAMVSAEGTFELADVPAGEYTVTWTSAGSPSAPRTIRVPEGVTTVPVTIELGSASLAGIVQRPDGSPVTGATVQVKTARGDAQAITGSDGTFSYTALDPGTATVRALARADGTAQATVELREDAVSEVELKVRPENQSKANVLVTSGGTPVPNAFVFVSRNGRVSASTTSADGRATIRLFDGDGPLHIAAYSGSHGWTFAQPQSPGDGEIAVEMTAGAASLSVRSEKLSPLAIVAPTGFPIHEALAILGSRPVVRPDSAYVLERLPHGSYTVSAGGMVRSAMLGNKPADVRF